MGGGDAGGAKVQLKVDEGRFLKYSTAEAQTTCLSVFAGDYVVEGFAFCEAVGLLAG